MTTVRLSAPLVHESAAPSDALRAADMQTAGLARPPRVTANLRNLLSSEYAALAVLLMTTTVTYLWNLSANGWANSFYAAAVHAGTKSWKAFFFGSSDAANSITVDKPPASLWPMELSARLFGLNSWSLLVPQVLMGVLTVAVLWACVRHRFGSSAGLLAGTALAVTPVAALMFRFDNPDALLVLLVTLSTAAMLRALEDGRTRWLVLCGTLVGFGFLTKQLQVMLVVPALALAYLFAGPPRLGKRLLQLFAAGMAIVVSAGWWLLAVELWPTSSRPWIGGSQHNSILELTMGYNGLGRLNGNERGSVGPPASGHEGYFGGHFGSNPGITRIFDAMEGGQIAWLLPAALVLLVVGIVLRGKAKRTDPQRAALILWGGWLLTTLLVFSFMSGIFHSYYTIALAPPIAALIGAGSAMLWTDRHRFAVRCTAALAVALTGITVWVLLSRTPHFVGWLRWSIAIATVIAVTGILWRSGKQTLAAALLAVLVGLAGPVAYTIQTIGTAHNNPLPSAGPRAGGMFGPPGAFPGHRGFPGGPNGPMGNPGDFGPGGPGFGGPGFGGPGGIFGSGTPSADVVAKLKTDASQYTWAAATVSSMNAAEYQLATDLPVMPIGGFNGTDPSPTLAQFQADVAAHRIHYFIGGSSRGGPGDSDSNSAQIAAWVKAHFTPITVGKVTLYPLT